MPVSSSPYEVWLPITISLLALLVSIYTLKKNLSQKRHEHRAKFFHEVVVENAIEPLLSFYETLLDLCNSKGKLLLHSKETPGHDERVKQEMREIRDKKRAAAARVCGLVAPFSSELEQAIQSKFDEAADSATEWLSEYTSGSTTVEPLARPLAVCQKETIDLLQAHEFQLGWPNHSLPSKIAFWRKKIE